MLDWRETWGHDVHIVNQTSAIGAINVAGPKAREVLSRVCDDDISKEAFPYLRHRRITVAGIPCTAIRLGFVGEVGLGAAPPRVALDRALGRADRGRRRRRHHAVRDPGPAAAPAREGAHHRLAGHRLRDHAVASRHGVGGQARQGRLRREGGAAAQEGPQDREARRVHGRHRAPTRRGRARP